VVKKRTILNGPDAVAKLNGTGGAWILYLASTREVPEELDRRSISHLFEDSNVSL
jgi:hypothetical protein